MGQGVEPISLNRGQFYRLVSGLAAFGRLKAVLGPARAEALAGLLYEREARESDPGARYAVVRDGDLPRYTARIEAALTAECDQIQGARLHAEALLDAAAQGALRQGLGDATDVPVRAAEGDIDRAADWICRTMHGDRVAAVRELLSGNAATPSGAVLGKTPEVLDRIHARLFPEAPAQRSPNPAVAYPSSIGGRHLLETVFGWTADALWPGPGDPGWLDVALFYLGAIGSAQGFADGNKRMARIAYALTLIRGSRRFVAPGEALEQTLIRMTHAPAAPGLSAQA